jgi:pimeloyl-ACP methyl ester carboxylesterase
MATAVLVHGAWSSPADWRWVAACLQAHGVGTVMPDLPSHRGRSTDRSDDVQEVEAAIRAAAPPVVVADWSYGGAVIGDVADTGPIGRLVYVGSVPEPVGTAAEDEPVDLASDPHMLFPDNATVVLDDDWWLGSEEVAAFPGEVVRHLREHRRRPVTRSALLAPPVAEAWQAVPTTILLGRSDSLIPVHEQERACTHFGDVRIVEGDHFLPLLQPDMVAGVIAETFATAH